MTLFRSGNCHLAKKFLLAGYLYERGIKISVKNVFTFSFIDKDADWLFSKYSVFNILNFIKISWIFLCRPISPKSYKKGSFYHLPDQFFITGNSI